MKLAASAMMLNVFLLSLLITIYHKPIVAKGSIKYQVCVPFFLGLYFNVCMAYREGVFCESINTNDTKQKSYY